jgi:uncharacterized protein (TIGR00297 family)
MNLKIRMMKTVFYLSPLLIPFINVKPFLFVLIGLTIAYTLFNRNKIFLDLANLNQESSILAIQLLAILLYILVYYSIMPVYIFVSSVISLFGTEMALSKEFRSFNIPVYIALISGSLLAFTLLYTRHIPPTILDYILYLGIIGAVTASLIDSLESPSDKRFVILLGVSMVLWLFDLFGYKTSRLELITGFLTAFGLGIVAFKSRVATETGLLSATLVGTIMIIFGGFKHFFLLISFYIAGSAFTKYKYQLKMERGIAEPEGGARGYGNVFGNSLAGMVFSLLYGITGEPVFVLALGASIATATGDTLASEIGETSSRLPRLITNFKPVKPGTSGGITFLGEMAALMGSLLIAIIGFAMNLYPLEATFLVWMAGFFGVHIDSLLGATLEESGIISNSVVNLISTFSGGLVIFGIFKGMGL